MTRIRTVHEHASEIWKNGDLGGGNSKIFGIFTPNIGEDEPILTGAYFSKRLVQPPASDDCILASGG